MYTFSKRSREQLNTCHPKLVQVLEAAIKKIDFSVIEGHRGEAEQNRAFAEGKSRLRWPDSKHNKMPSEAVDIWPYPFKPEYWNQIEVWENLAKVVLECAEELGIKIRWGGDWNQNGDWRDEKFIDGPHFELME